MSDLYEKSLTSKKIFEGRIFYVTLDEAELQNGRVAKREVVHHNGGAAVVALDSDGKVALVRQYRYALGRVLTELPAGKLNPGEAPREAALRELAEEAGISARHVEDFGSIIPTCGYCTEVIYLYLATGLSQTGQNLDADEFVDILWLPLEEAVQMVLDGTITDAKTVTGLLRAKYQREHGLLPL